MLNPSDVIESLTAQSVRADLLQLSLRHSDIVIHLVHCRMRVDVQQQQHTTDCILLST